MWLINFLKKNKILTTIMVVHLFIGPVLYQSLGMVDIEFAGRFAWFRFWSLYSNGFYWLLTAVLVFLFWLYKK